MIHLIFERASGRVVGHIEAEEPPVVMDHHDTMVCDRVPDLQLVQVVDDTLIDVLPAGYLMERKRRAIVEVERARDDRLKHGLETPHGTVQGDSDSRVNLSGAVQSAQLSRDPLFRVGWRMADNTTVELDRAEIMDIGMAMSEFVEGVFRHSFALKDQVKGVQSLGELDAVVIDFDRLVDPPARQSRALTVIAD